MEMVQQKAFDHFHFDYVSNSDLAIDQKEKIKKMIDIYLEPGLKISFERKEQIDRVASGKFKHFQRLF